LKAREGQEHVVRKSKFSEDQIIGFLREADAGLLPVKELCRRPRLQRTELLRLWQIYGQVPIT
jgi:hypothetical protein